MSVFVDNSAPFLREMRVCGFIRCPFTGNLSRCTNCPETGKIALSDEKAKKHYICGVVLWLRLGQVHGEMAEWSIAAVLKTVVRATGPGVRIPLSPQGKSLPSVLD